MRAFPAVHFVAHLAFGIGNEQAALRPLHEDDESHQTRREHREQEQQQGICGAGARADSKAWPISCGNRATMPPKMISEMPLPTPRLVICSPIHIRRMVPPVSVIIAV